VTEALPPPWDPDRDDTLNCVAIRPETHDIATFIFAPPQPRLFQFLPGQFMTFDLDAVGVQRCYTIASPPTRPWRIEITTKRSGPASTWLHNALKPGMQLKASGPMGDFTFGASPAGPFLFLSAGSGITPMMSMARTLHDLGSPADVLFVHSARTPSDLPFTGDLAALAHRPGFRSINIVSRDTPGHRWDGFRGRLTPAMLAVLAPDLHTRTVFCCGPAPYMASVRAMLVEAGFDLRRYHEESFDFTAPAEEPPPPPITAATGSFTVQFARSNQTIGCAPDTTVLAAARAAGIRLPSACGKGVCGTCKSRLLAGSVAMKHGGGIRPREIDEGLALLCCARPTSDLVIDR
jgi:ferredoxin-NADP reductase